MKPRPQPLAEIPEHQAAGDIRAIFADLRRHVGLVALIYRHLATFPGALEWTWGILGPTFESGQLPARAARVRNAVDLGPARRWGAFQAFVRGQFAPADLAGIGDVIEGYNRANPSNILGVLVLARALGSPPFDGAVAAPLGDQPGVTGHRHPQLPALIAIADLDRDLAEEIAGLASRGVTDTDGIVPSLYRHLANWPGYLAEAARALSPLFVSGEIEAMANRVRRDAQSEAEAVFVGLGIGEPPPFDDETRMRIMVSLETFVRRIPEMTVVGVLLRAALPGRDGARAGRTDQ